MLPRMCEWELKSNKNRNDLDMGKGSWHGGTIDFLLEVAPRFLDKEVEACVVETTPTGWSNEQE
jgi:hypothetical protein